MHTKTSESIANVLKARIKAQKEMRQPKKDGFNPHFKSKYTTYEELMSCIREVLFKNGLDMVVNLLEKDGHIGCQITLYHESGEFITSEPFYLSAPETVQGQGSAATYVRRYCISSFWALASEDDDGELTTKPKPSTAKNTSIYPGRSSYNKSLSSKYQHIKNELDSSEPASVPKEEDRIRKGKQCITDKCMQNKISDAQLKGLIKEKFNKETLNFLTLQEMYNLYKHLEEVG